ncbi:MAG: RNA polymerase sigma factor [Verrucomicrobia bacterium]|nr:RNA polymerase sigma factor [Verrucomicrobiota bacterium]
MTTLSAPVALHDAQLVARSLDGDAEAFGKIVGRYQTLVCSLAYSACGNVHLSEDLAQDTFIAAWRDLRDLREPTKLKSWLCGIARNVVNNSLRQQQRTPTSQADALDDSLAYSTAAVTPRDYVMSQQEEAIVWRALRELPESYREPLVLYYRHGESAAAVADALDLSQDAVNQRLSRGRAMLAEQVSRLVQTTLRHSGPTQAFTLGVVAALPMLATSVSAGTVAATAAKGGATAKAAGWLAILQWLLTPVMTIFGSYFLYKLDRDEARTPQRRAFVTQMWRLTLTCVAVSVLVVVGVVFLKPMLVKTHPEFFAVLVISLGAACTVFAVVTMLWASRQERRFHLDETASRVEPVTPAFEYRSKLGLLGWPLVHIRLRGGLERGPVKAWIAAGDAAIGLVFAFGALAVAPISVGGIGIGVLSISGLSLGLVSLGSLSFGVWALGGFAMGWQAFGGCTVAWTAAQGGVAVACKFAVGSVALASHANDLAARAFLHDSVFFQAAGIVIRHVVWLNVMWLLPLVLWWRRHRGRRPKRCVWPTIDPTK